MTEVKLHFCGHGCGSNSYFLHWNFDWKSCFVGFFLEWKEWKNPQFNFSSQILGIERNFFKWDGKENKILHLLFHRIWKNLYLIFLKLPFKNINKYNIEVRQTYLVRKEGTPYCAWWRTMRPEADYTVHIMKRSILCIFWNFFFTW